MSAAGSGLLQGSAGLAGRLLQGLQTCRGATNIAAADLQGSAGCCRLLQGLQDAAESACSVCRVCSVHARSAERSKQRSPSLRATLKLQRVDSFFKTFRFLFCFTLEFRYYTLFPIFLSVVLVHRFAQSLFQLLRAACWRTH